MRRYWSAVLIVVAFQATTPLAQAGWMHRACRHLYCNYVRSERWPRPYILPDREAVVEPFHIMVNNGWKAQNTLDPSHFQKGTGELTEAGRLKVYFITTHAPPQFRTIYVTRDLESEETANRMASVQKFLGMMPNAMGDMVQVVETSIAPPGWPADYVDTIGRKFAESTPDPRLPESSGTAGAGE